VRFESPLVEHIAVSVGIEKSRSAGVAAIGTNMIVSPSHVDHINGDQDKESETGDEKKAYPTLVFGFWTSRLDLLGLSKSLLVAAITAAHTFQDL